MQKVYVIILYVALGFITILVFLTKGQPLLVKRKIFLGILLLSLTAPAVTVISCKSGGDNNKVNRDQFQTDGWVDGNTYRITATGIPRKKLTDPVEKKKAAKTAAILYAQSSIIDRWIGSRVNSCGGMPDLEISTPALSLEMNEIVKKGTILSETYDEELNCEIVYEVKQKNLKKKVTSSAVLNE